MQELMSFQTQLKIDFLLPFTGNRKVIENWRLYQRNTN